MFLVVNRLRMPRFRCVVPKSTAFSGFFNTWRQRGINSSGIRMFCIFADHTSRGKKKKRKHNGEVVTDEKIVIAHWDEIGLKGENRNHFTGQLARNVASAFRDFSPVHVRVLYDRLRVRLPSTTQEPAIVERFSRIFGIRHFSIVETLPLNLHEPDIDALGKAVLKALEKERFETFRMTVRRSNKALPITSMDLARQLGSVVVLQMGKKVKLVEPDLNVSLSCGTHVAYLSKQRFRGPGGLPVASQGRVACLLSGGFDSPVAAFRMIKRGAQAVFVHFSSRPLVGRDSEDKVKDLVQLLTRYQNKSRLLIVPFGELQREVVVKAPSELRVILYRRLMVRIAERLAQREKCWALVTGDALGQVASQTPENLSVVGNAVSLPLLRPLIGMDKMEIIDQAKLIDTFSASCEPDQDCCKLFLPPHVCTHAKLPDVLAAEQLFAVDELVERAVESAELSTFIFPNTSEGTTHTHL